jgi:hypothetical protein
MTRIGALDVDQFALYRPDLLSGLETAQAIRSASAAFFRSPISRLAGPYPGHVRISCTD